CTDPPFYDTVEYADLSDFFYLWLRRALGAIEPDLFALPRPSREAELVASPYRLPGRPREAQRRFAAGMAEVFTQMHRAQHSDFPLVLFYAFKRPPPARAAASGAGASGWEALLEALVAAGWQVTAAWPLRTERDRGLKRNANTLGSSVVLAEELPPTLAALRAAGIAPADLVQAGIGRGVALCSRFAAITDAQGAPLA